MSVVVLGGFFHVPIASADFRSDTSASAQNLARYLHGPCNNNALNAASEALEGAATATGIAATVAGAAGLDSFPMGMMSTVTGTLSSYIVEPCPGDPSVSGAVLPTTGRMISLAFQSQPSSREYIADMLDNMGLPQAQSAFAQGTSAGTGYDAMQPFLPFWKVFRNAAYSLYIIMFIVIGVMIMLRTKVNAQTVITIQSALPNLLVTLILITFSYAIVGFMIDLMYFLIYFVVYLANAGGIISDPGKLITRFLSYSAWSVIFQGRNSIISAVASSIGSVLWGLGSGAIGLAGVAVSIISPMYLIVAVAFAIQMIKLMFVLLKSYVMLIVQTVTAPIQILFNAMPGSKAFGDWLKKTASYLIPFPVAAGMFLFSAILVGNPTDKTLLGSLDPRDANPFGVDQGHPLYANRDKIWLPPFTLTDAKVYNADVLTLIGFFIFLMTPAAAKMAQDWLQVKESPYTSEAISGISAGVKGGMLVPNWLYSQKKEEERARMQARYLGSQIQRSVPGVSEKKQEAGEKAAGA